MADLIEKTPYAGLLPWQNSVVRVDERVIAQAWGVASFAGKTAAVSKAMQSQYGFGFPATNQVARSEAGYAVWVAAGRALLVGDEAPKAKGAALTEQGDGIAALVLSGAGALEVMARLTPVDLRLSAFPVGETRRTMLGHMMGSVIRLEEQAFELHVMRSMALTLLHEVKEAAQHLAGRGEL